MNDLAWLLATCPDPSVRNAAEAVRWAEQVAAQEASSGHLDTLAAAYAEAGRWDEALAAERRALDSLELEAAPPGLRKSVEEHLARIERREPIRDGSGGRHVATGGAL